MIIHVAGYELDAAEFQWGRQRALVWPASLIEELQKHFLARRKYYLHLWQPERSSRPNPFANQPHHVGDAIDQLRNTSSWPLRL